MRRLVLVVTVVLVASGRGPLAPPRSWSDVGGWIEERGTVTASVALVRLLALVVVAWVLVVWLVVVTARAFGAVRVATLAAGVLPAVVASALNLVPAAAQTYDEGTATMSVLPDDAVSTTATPPPAPVERPQPPAEEWTVAPGESFWSIAEDVVAESLGRAPSVAEIDGYWRALIDANRDRLASPSPDLVRPGQVFVLPPVTTAA